MIRLQEAMMRPQTEGFRSGLAAKNKKAQLLGGKREVFKKPEEDHLATATKKWISDLSKHGDCPCYRGDREHYPM